MKEYLLKFRSQAFDGAISLFRRVLLPNILLTFIMTFISLAIIIPLTLKSFGWSLSDYMNMDETMKAAGQNASSSSNPFEVFMSVFGTINPLFLTLTIIISILIYCWMFYTFMKLNDLEVRERNNSIVSALASSFSGKVFTILIYSLLYSIMNLVITVVFFFLIAMLASVSTAAGVFVGFVGFFILLMFLLRFSLGLPAIVHGNMTISEAISFSVKNITWKRAGLILFIGIILVIALLLLLGILSFVALLFVEKDSVTVSSFVVQQILTSIAGAIVTAFIYASMTALYFRYSNDHVEDMDVKDHLIS
jgi:hypothetical protein